MPKIEFENTYMNINSVLLFSDYYDSDARKEINFIKIKYFTKAKVVGGDLQAKNEVFSCEEIGA